MEITLETVVFYFLAVFISVFPFSILLNLQALSLALSSQARVLTTCGWPYFS